MKCSPKKGTFKKFLPGTLARLVDSVEVLRLKDDIAYNHQDDDRQINKNTIVLILRAQESNVGDKTRTNYDGQSCS